jgi:hypothetical protein
MIFATRLDVVRASSRAALSRAAFADGGTRAVKTTATGAAFFGFTIAFPVIKVYAYLCHLSHFKRNAKMENEK